MLTARRPILLAVALLGTLSLAPHALANDWGSTVRKTVELTIAHQANAGVAVEAENGGIEIEADPDAREVTVSAEIRAKNQERLAQVTIKAHREADGTLKVWAEWPGDKRENNEGCSFRIEIPDANGVACTTRNGAISIDGLTGPAVLSTSNGAISVDGHRGTVEANTSNGAITVDGAVGSVVASSSNGAIDIDGATGPIEAETSNGRIEVALAGGAVGPVNLETSNGSIGFSFAPGFVGKLEMKTSMGGIVFSDANGEEVKFKNKGEILVGGESPVCALRTSNGSIRVSVEAD